MANSIAPGVYTKIIDLSTYLTDIPGGQGFIPFFSRTGPDNVLTDVFSLTEFATLYGRPNINDYGKAFGLGPYIAWNHMTVSPVFHALRLLPTDATYSNIMITYNSDSTGSIVVSHELGANTLDDIDTALETTSGAPGTSPTLAQVIAITSDDISAKADLLSFADDEGASYYTPIAGDRVASTFDNKIYVAQASGVTWTVASDGVLTNGDSFIALNDLTQTPGSAEINSQYAMVLGSLTKVAFTGELYPMFAIYGVGRGDAYDDFAVTIERHPNENQEGVHFVNIWRTQIDGEDSIIETFEVSFDLEAVDDSGDSLFIEEVINRYSEYVRVRVNEDHLNEYNKSAPDISIGDSLTPFHLFGGSEGSLVTIDPDTGKRTIDSTVATQLLVDGYLGLIDDNVIDLDDIYFPLVYDAGYPTDVKNAIVTLVNDVRRDGVAIMDNGDNATYSDAIISRENNHTYNSKYVALYESYSKIFDSHTGKDMFVSPVYHMASMIPLNDKLYEIWYPNAGFNRGTIRGIKELRYNPKLGQREQFQLKQINPIVKFSIGYVVFGNLTTQLRPSKLQDLSIMRMVLYIKRALEQALKFFIFEFNDAQAHQLVSNQLRPFLTSVQEARGLESFSVEVGATDYEKKRKIMHVNVTLVPTGIIERIELNLFIK